MIVRKRLDSYHVVSFGYSSYDEYILSTNERRPMVKYTGHGNYCLWWRVSCKYFQTWPHRWAITIPGRNGVVNITLQWLYFFYFCSMLIVCCFLYSLLLFRNYCRWWRFWLNYFWKWLCSWCIPISRSIGVISMTQKWLFWCWFY